MVEVEAIFGGWITLCCVEYSLSFRWLKLKHAYFYVTGNKIRWEKPGHSPAFGYDYWYQPRHKTMISSSWGAPCAFSKGFDLQHVKDGLYGRHLSVYSWPDGELKQTLDLGDSGLLPLEVFLSYILWTFKDLCVAKSFPDFSSFAYDVTNCCIISTHNHQCWEHL